MRKPHFTKGPQASASCGRGSSAGPEAAATPPAEVRGWGGRPGEDRHLMRERATYAHGLLGGRGLSPARLPRGERGGWGKAPCLFVHPNSPKTPSNNLIHGTKVRQPCATRVSGGIGLLKTGFFYNRIFAMKGVYETT